MSATPDAAEGIPVPDNVPQADLGKRIESLKAFLASRPPRAGQTGHSATPDPPPPDDTSRPGHALRPHASPLPDDWTRRLWIAAATTLAVGAALVLIVIGIPPSFRAPATGTLSIDTRPTGLSVVIDGVPKGVTPIEVELTPGDHVTELFAGSEHRRIPVTIRAGSQSSQFFEMATAAASSGGSELRVRTEPLGASVLVDGRYVGRSPVSVGDLSPGPHTIVMQRDGATVTEQVLIEASKTASLFVPLSQKPVGPGAAGWISVAAPVDVQLFEDGRLLGSSKIDQIMMPAGRHELDIVNEALGYQEHRTVRVTAGEVAAVPLKWPTGSLSINAIPWAEAFVDGTSVGETPIGNIQVPLGPHEITLRNPQLGERRASVTVTSRDAAKVGVDLRAK